VNLSYSLRPGAIQVSRFRWSRTASLLHSPSLYSATLLFFCANASRKVRPDYHPRGSEHGSRVADQSNIGWALAKADTGHTRGLSKAVITWPRSARATVHMFFICTFSLPHLAFCFSFSNQDKQLTESRAHTYIHYIQSVTMVSFS